MVTCETASRGPHGARSSVDRRPVSDLVQIKNYRKEKKSRWPGLEETGDRSKKLQ